MAVLTLKSFKRLIIIVFVCVHICVCLSKAPFRLFLRTLSQSAKNSNIKIFVLTETSLEMSLEKIRGIISDLPRDNPAECESLIRKLYKRITSSQDTDEKENLLDELQDVAYRGLQEDLMKMLEENGLRLEALPLVVRCVTSTGELATYLYSHSKEDLKKEDLANVDKRLRPHLEVLGGLISEGIDSTKEWVKRLCRKAPSFKVLSRLESSELQSYCQGADDGEMDQVRQLVKTVTLNEKKKLPDVPQDDRLVQNTKSTKAVDKANLKEAKELMNEAKTMATDKSETAKETNDKTEKIEGTIELPPDWCEQLVQSDQMFQQIGQIKEQCSAVVESNEICKNPVGVIIKASGGKALFGIYHSEYEVPKPPARPLLLPPTNVSLTSPCITTDTNFMKFSAQGAAADYIRTVESVNTNIGHAIAVSEGLLFGEVQGAYGSGRQKRSHGSVREWSTSASVLHYIRMPTKSFQLEHNQIQLSESAKEMARSIAQDTDKPRRQEMARIFLQRYGSHFPAGVQTLGGMFFSIADAESKKKKKKFELMSAAAGYIKEQMSLVFRGAFGTGGSTAGEHSGSKGSNVGKNNESCGELITFSVRSIGPTTTNPDTFQKLLSDNSTWALIDRGPVEGFIPVWELLKDLGSEYETAADVLENIWQCDEEKKKDRKIAKDELLLMKEDFFATVRMAKL